MKIAAIRYLYQGSERRVNKTSTALHSLLHWVIASLSLADWHDSYFFLNEIKKTKKTTICTLQAFIYKIQIFIYHKYTPDSLLFIVLQFAGVVHAVYELYYEEIKAAISKPLRRFRSAIDFEDQ